ncbi:MAG: HlyD family secretion protein, partial [Celeribacter sp.]
MTQNFPPKTETTKIPSALVAPVDVPQSVAPIEPVQWSVRGPLIVGLICILVLFGGFGLWAVVARID